MLPGRKYTPDDIMRLLWRRRWLIIAPLFACAFLALLVARQQPDLYQSETLVQVLPQRVPDSFVRSTVTSTVEERLKTITEVIKSHTRLQQIIEEFDLYPDARTQQTMDDVVERMRADILIEIAGTSPTGRRAPGPVSAFNVSFTYKDKEKALRVTQRLTELLIAENTRMRGNLAEATNEFLETQLADARRRLEEQERKLEVFRERHAGRLPSQMQANMQGVQSTQMALQALVESLARDRDRKLMYERLYNDANAELTALQSAPPTPPPGSTGQTGPDALPATATPQQRLAAARATLARLELRLTPEHPDIIQAKRQIRDLESLVSADAAKDKDQPGRQAPQTSPDLLARTEQLRQRKAEIESLERQIEFKEAEGARLRRQLGEYQSRIEAVPGIESEWVALTRDYDTLQETYKAMLAKSEDSKVAENLERRQIGEQFRVLDAPRVSDQATGSNRLRINMVGLALGLVLGLGLVGLTEFRDSSFRSEADVLNALSLPVLASVPFAPTERDVDAARRRRLAFSTAAMVVLAGSAVVFWYLQLWKFVV